MSDTVSPVEEQQLPKKESSSTSSVEVPGSDKDKRIIKICFVFFGIATLLVFNALLSDIDFFNHYQATETRNPSVIYPFLNFILNILFQFVIICSKKKKKYKNPLILSIVFQLIALILLPVSVLCFEKKSNVSFYFTSGIVFIMGYITAVCTSYFMGLASHFPVENIVSLSLGQGLAGILMNVLKYLTLIFLPVKEGDPNEEKMINLGTLVFFSVSGLVMIICFIFLVIAYNNEYFIAVLEKCGQIGNIATAPTIENPPQMPERDYLLPKGLDDTTRSSIRDSIDNTVLVNQMQTLETEDDKTNSFLFLIKQLMDINILIFLAYVVTFTVFPGACLQPALFGLNDHWKPNTVVTIFNIFDTLGRKCVSFFKPRKWMLWIATLIRFVFLFSIPYDDYLDHKGYAQASSILLIGNVVFIAFTNGIATSLAYALGPKCVRSYLKGKAGSSVSFFNIVGIFTGTVAAFGMDALIRYLQKQ